MAVKMRSAVLAIKEETTEGKLELPTASTDFTALRQGFGVESSVETVESDELVNDIGASAGFVTRESPTATINKYFKHSGIEGTPPDYALLLRSSMGTQYINGTEYDTVAGSTAGDSASRAAIVVDTGEGTNFRSGQAILLKDGANGYRIRNVEDVSGDSLSLNYNVPNAPDAGVGLGKAVHYAPGADGHTTYSVHLYQSSQASKFYQAVTGCRTTSTAISFPVNALAEINFSVEGIEYFLNPVVVTATNNKIDFNEGGTSKVAVLAPGTYKSPLEFAKYVEGVLDAAADANILIGYDSKTGRFTVSGDGATLELEWSSGTNTAETAGALLGFDTSADSTGATTYTGTAARSLSPDVAPTYDDNDPTVVKNNELVIGGFDRFECRSSNNVSLTIATPKTDVEDICARSGVSGSVVLNREVTLSATLIFKEHEVGLFDDFIANKTTSIMFNHGPKSGGNWVSGRCVNVYMPNAKLTSHTISESDGIAVLDVEAKGFVSADRKDLHVNFI